METKSSITLASGTVSCLRRLKNLMQSSGITQLQITALPKEWQKGSESLIKLETEQLHGIVVLQETGPFTNLCHSVGEHGIVAEDTSSGLESIDHLSESNLKATAKSFLLSKGYRLLKYLPRSENTIESQGSGHQEDIPTTIPKDDQTLENSGKKK